MIFPQAIRNAVAGLVREADQPTFVGLQLLPEAPSLHTGAYLIEPLKTARQNKVKKVARGAKIPRDESTYTEDTFKTEKYALGTVLPDDDLAKVEEKYAVNLLANEINIKKNQLYGAHDERVATEILGAGFQLANRIGRYDVPADAKPLQDVRVAKAYGAARGVKYDTVAMGQNLYYLIAAIVESARLTNSGRVTAVTREDVRTFLDIENLIIFETEYDTTGKGLAASLAPIFPTDKMCVCKKGVPNTVSPDGAGIGRTYSWENAPRGGAMVNFDIIDQPEDHATLIQVYHNTDEKIVNLKAGYIINHCVSETA